MNHIINTSKKYKPLWFLSLLVLLLLAACNTSPRPVPTEPDVSQLATVAIAATDSRAVIEARYNAKAIVFRPEAGFAILGFTEEQAKLTTLTTELDSEVTAPDVDDADANGNSAWGGGQSAWGGGQSAWGGGQDDWSGGSAVPGTPEAGYAIWGAIQLPEAHMQSSNFGQGVKVAVIDTGIDLAHPMFQDRLAPADEWFDFAKWDSDPQEEAGDFYGHGTAVSGIVLQVAPNATILPLRALDGKGKGKVSRIAMAIDEAVYQGAHVINLSLGTTSNSSILREMVDYAESQGLYVVSSAGNEGQSHILNPADYAFDSSFVTSVGSLDSTDCRSDFSNYSESLNVSAPGEQVYTAFPDSRIGHATGTSFAAPMVSGMYALAYSETTDALKRQQLKSYLTSAASLNTPNCTGSVYGKVSVLGMLDALE